MTDLMEKISSLVKRRGFIYQGSEIYGGLANTYDYGPMGSELLRNIKNLWWDFFVTKRTDIYGLDTSVLTNPKIWEASGHVANFADTSVDCKNCQLRTRADHLIENHFEEKDETVKVEGKSPDELHEIIEKEHIICPKCGKSQWTAPRKINTLFETQVGIVVGDKSQAYLRGETAQGMFVNFKNVLDSMALKLPFGLAQSGIAFRNEITLGKITFRTLQFNLSEFEYFFDPETQNWEDLYNFWEKEMWIWSTKVIGLSEDNLRFREHDENERSHYSKRTKDIEYNYPWGYKELYGLAYRTDFDLKNHMEQSGVDLQYTDSTTGRKFVPHVIEPAFGIDRTLLALLFDAYNEEEVNGKTRIYLKLKPSLSPFKAAVFPLLANKPDLVAKARTIFEELHGTYNIAWDDRGNIGKRYFAQDEIGTPYCITVDFQTLEDDTVTVRDRDTAKQQRMSVSSLFSFISEKVNS